MPSAEGRDRKMPLSRGPVLAAVEASRPNQCVRDTVVEDLDFYFERLKLDFEVLSLPFEGVGKSLLFPVPHWRLDTNLFAVNIPATEEIAIKIASEASTAVFDPSNRLFFANKTQENKHSSAAGGEAGLIAISRCLSLVTSDLLRRTTST